MKICSISDLIKENYNIVFVNALQQFWRTNRSFQCFENSKKQNLFLFLNRCKAKYTDKSGKETFAESGDVVYVPISSKYKVELYDFEDETAHTIGINFFIYDTFGEKVVMSSDITVFSNSAFKQLEILFNNAVRSDLEGPILKSKIVLSQIICTLAAYHSKANSPIIEKALDFWARNIAANPSVSQTAKHCNVSEVYFRRIFKDVKGITPHEFLHEMRMSRAASYLEFSDASVQEISETLGYSDVSYFIDVFHKHFGCTPLKFRKNILP